MVSAHPGPEEMSHQPVPAVQCEAIRQILRSGIMLHNQEAVVVLLQDGHELEGGKGCGALPGM